VGLVETPLTSIAATATATATASVTVRAVMGRGYYSKNAQLHTICDVLQSLSKQHEVDLEIYQRAHTEWRNRLLHSILIPVEAFSFLLFLTVALSVVTSRRQWQKDGKCLESLIMQAIGWTTGLVSLSITGSDNISIGTASLLFHPAAVAVCDKMVREKGPWKAIGIAASSWTIAWTLQVGVGHWLLEHNQPNVANMNEVSWLAMTQSVLIAWSS
jgi:uncharacterized membrane protein YGL010W